MQCQQYFSTMINVGGYEQADKSKMSVINSKLTDIVYFVDTFKHFSGVFFINLKYI